MEVSVTGLNELIAGLDRAHSKALPETEQVVAKGALNVKQDWAVTYDLFHLPGSIRAEVGPDKGRRQGALGNLLEFGSAHNAPRPGGLPALSAEAPRMEKALAELAEKLLGG
jgi:hypothetical protein